MNQNRVPADAITTTAITAPRTVEAVIAASEKAMIMSASSACIPSTAQ